jgi:hypothetical protein
MVVSVNLKSKRLCKNKAHEHYLEILISIASFFPVAMLPNHIHMKQRAWRFATGSDATVT